MQQITQKDIARELGVSRITVSKALSGSPDISLKMREKVRLVARKKGYIPNHMARNLQRHKTNTVGVVVPDVSNSFFSFAIDGIMDMASKHGYHVMLTVSRENADTEQENIITLLSHRVDGLLVAISKDTHNSAIFKTVKKMDIPLVFFDRAIEGLGLSSVGIDDREAAAELVEYVIRCGYTKIAHLAGCPTIAIGRERRAGYEDALRKYKVPLKDGWIIAGGFDKTSGYDGFRRLQKLGGLPEVIFAANDRIAQGAYKAIKEAGLQIPDDIGVVALGHEEFAEILSPPLTIMHSSPDVIGREAMNMLVEDIGKRTGRKARHIILKAVLKLHGSLRVPSKENKII